MKMRRYQAITKVAQLRLHLTHKCLSTAAKTLDPPAAIESRNHKMSASRKCQQFRTLLCPQSVAREEELVVRKQGRSRKRPLHPDGATFRRENPDQRTSPVQLA